jgi:hypothetical protein
MDNYAELIRGMAEAFLTVVRIQQDEIARLESECEYLHEELRYEQMRNTEWNEREREEG